MLPENRSKIDEELRHAEAALREGNDGRARACARRAAGIAISEWESGATRRSAVDRLKSLAASDGIPLPVRNAAQRLVTNVNDRLSERFTLHPVNDARIIIEHLNAMTLPGS